MGRNGETVEAGDVYLFDTSGRLPDCNWNYDVSHLRNAMTGPGSFEGPGRGPEDLPDFERFGAPDDIDVYVINQRKAFDY